MKTAIKPRWADRNLHSLARIALQHWGTNKGWDAIYRLQLRGSEEVLLFTQRLTRSCNWRKRALGQYIAGQLHRRSDEDPYIEYALAETHAILLQGLQDNHREVVRAAVSGIGHRPYTQALPYLEKLAKDASADMRWAVAIALGKFPEEEAVEALLVLAQDRSDAVRDWATFGLGTMRAADTPAIRELLWCNLSDKDSDVRGEALVGLAKRNDQRIIPVLFDSLNRNCLGYDLEAAQLMAHPRLLPALEALQAAVIAEGNAEGYWYRQLTNAIAACAAG